AAPGILNDAGEKVGGRVFSRETPGGGRYSKGGQCHAGKREPSRISRVLSVPGGGTLVMGRDAEGRGGMGNRPWRPRGIMRYRRAAGGPPADGHRGVLLTPRVREGRRADAVLPRVSFRVAPIGGCAAARTGLG